MFLSENIFFCYYVIMYKKSFILCESLIYITFIVFDILNKDSLYIKYLGIVVCFLFSLKSKNIASIALATTLCADFFLLVLNKHYEIGLLFFIITQLTYCFYLNNKNYLYVRFICFVFGLIVLFVANNISLLNVLVIFYFSNLLINCIESFKLKDKTLFVGLLLFVCCDICVGLFNTNVSTSLYNFVSFMMWVFYLPSQVLICLYFFDNRQYIKYKNPVTNQDKG